MVSSARRAALAIVALLLAATAPLAAQGGHLVTLRIKPHVGDTLYTRFEQQVEITGTARVGAVDSTMTMRSAMLLLAHIVVQAGDETGTTVITTTDSLSLTGQGVGAGTTPDAVRQAMQGKRVRLHIAPDGSATVEEAPAEIAPDMQAMVSGMPATLPDHPVPVGGTWQTVMSIPVAGREAAGARPATLRATYHLDSLARGGDVAYISVHGTITRDPASEMPQGIRITSSGTIDGSMQVDLHRGWWCDSRAAIALRSVVSPLAGSRPPMHVVTRITQWMHTGMGH